MKRLLLTFLVFLQILTVLDVAAADEAAHRAWGKYLIGTWQVRLEHFADGAWRFTRQGTSTFRELANGHALFEQVHWDSGETGISLRGWRAIKKHGFVQGIDSSGRLTEIEINEEKETRVRGTVLFTRASGLQSSGEIELRKISPDRFDYLSRYTFRGKPMKLRVIHRRVQEEKGNP